MSGLALPRRSERPELVFLSHAVDRSGPPIYLRHLLGWLGPNTDVPTRVVALEGGDLEAEFQALTRLQVIGEPNPLRVRRGSRPLTEARNALRGLRLRDLHPRSLLYINTAWSVRAMQYVPDHAGPVVAHVHELEVGLDYHLPPGDTDRLFRRPDHWIAASAAVADNLAERWDVPRDEILVHHEMIDVAAPSHVPDAEVDLLRRSIGAGPDALVVGTTAVLNWRKAPDLYLELAAKVLHGPGDPDVHFAWVGVDERSPEVAALRRDARRAGIADRIHLVAVSDRPEAWMRAFDVFVLPAREDAYPLAALEAAAAGRPVVCFQAGGMPEFVGTDAGAVVDFPDVDAMAAVVERFRADPAGRRAMGDVARARVAERHDVAVAAPRLWADLGPWVPVR
ncbi:MAG: glycosyltransferase family 4 protein [Aquihabitans sp.]